MLIKTSDVIANIKQIREYAKIMVDDIQRQCITNQEILQLNSIFFDISNGEQMDNKIIYYVCLYYFICCDFSLLGYIILQMNFPDENSNEFIPSGCSFTFIKEHAIQEQSGSFQVNVEQRTEDLWKVSSFKFEGLNIVISDDVTDVIQCL